MPSVNDNFFNVTVQGDYGSRTYKVAAVNNSGERIRLPQEHIESLTPELQTMLQGMLHATTRETKTRLSQALSQSGGGLRFEKDHSIYAYTNNNPSETLQHIEGIVNNYFPTSMTDGDESPLLRPIQSPAESPFFFERPAREDEVLSPFDASPIPTDYVRPHARRAFVESPEIQPAPPVVPIALAARAASVFDDVYAEEDDSATSYAEYPYTHEQAQPPLIPDLSEADEPASTLSLFMAEEDDTALQSTQRKPPGTKSWYNPMKYLSRKTISPRADLPDANATFFSALDQRSARSPSSASALDDRP